MLRSESRVRSGCPVHTYVASAPPSGERGVWLEARQGFAPRELSAIRTGG